MPKSEPTRPLTPGDRIDRAMTLEELTDILRGLSLMDDIAQAHRWADECMAKALRIITSGKAVRREADELVQRFERMEKLYG